MFTDSPFTPPQAEDQHRDHAIIEQVNADLINGPLAQMSLQIGRNGRESRSVHPG
ncbi:MULTISPECIES: hypothetical protein [Protofrankia]|uniref:hypothetical protein n=1 Tax=Protofrankia TaxID=2994361 RepID=UPI000B20EAD5|nr:MULTISPECIES: hypothetical protein [Protofrankia]